MKSEINVIIVDDQKLMRQGIIKMFEDHSHINVVHEASDGIEIINWLKENKSKIRVDVILMDMQMPNMDGWEATELITRKYKSLKIIGLSSYDNEAFVDRLMKNGGRGYLLKVQEINEIVDYTNSCCMNIGVMYSLSSTYHFNGVLAARSIKPFKPKRICAPKKTKID